MSLHALRFRLNGEPVEVTVPANRLLVDLLRDDLGKTGTKLGCGVGVCGACSVLVDGELVSSCLLPAVAVDGAQVTTVEGLAPEPDRLHPIQEAFWDAHGLQCGFCTAGMLITTVALLRDKPRPSDDEIRVALSGNLCRCTGYQNVVKAVRIAAERVDAL